MGAVIRVQRQGKNRVAFLGKYDFFQAATVSVLTAEGPTAEDARQNLLDKLHAAMTYANYSEYRRAEDGTMFRLFWAVQSECFAYDLVPAERNSPIFHFLLNTDNENSAYSMFMRHVSAYKKSFEDGGRPWSTAAFRVWAERDVTYWELRRTGYGITDETARRAAIAVESKPKEITAIWDSPESGDRYTVVMEKLAPHRYAMFAINDLPFHPSCGFFQYVEGDNGPHLGRAIDWIELPAIVRWAVIQRLRVDDTPETSEETNG